MTKIADDTVLDAALDEIALANRMDVCSGDPANRAAVITNTLGNVAMVGGDYTNANGDTSGRKVTVAAKAGVSVTATGTALTVTLISATLMLYKTDCTSQALTSGNTVNFPAWDVEILDPT